MYWLGTAADETDQMASPTRDLIHWTEARKLRSFPAAPENLTPASSNQARRPSSPGAASS